MSGQFRRRNDSVTFNGILDPSILHGRILIVCEHTYGSLDDTLVAAVMSLDNGDNIDDNLLGLLTEELKFDYAASVIGDENTFAASYLSMSVVFLVESVGGEDNLGTVFHEHIDGLAVSHVVVACEYASRPLLCSRVGFERVEHVLLL